MIYIKDGRTVDGINPALPIIRNIPSFPSFRVLKVILASAVRDSKGALLLITQTLQDRTLQNSPPITAPISTRKRTKNLSAPHMSITKKQTKKRTKSPWGEKNKGAPGPPAVGNDHAGVA